MTVQNLDECQTCYARVQPTASPATPGTMLTSHTVSSTAQAHSTGPWHCRTGSNCCLCTHCQAVGRGWGLERMVVVGRGRGWEGSQSMPLPRPGSRCHSGQWRSRTCTQSQRAAHRTAVYETEPNCTGVVHFGSSRRHTCACMQGYSKTNAHCVQATVVLALQSNDRHDRKRTWALTACPLPAGTCHTSLPSPKQNPHATIITHQPYCEQQSPGAQHCPFALPH